MEGVSERVVVRIVLWAALIIIVGGTIVSSLSVSPHNIVLSDYAQSQEYVITFYNDEFKPLLMSLTPHPESEYLSEYVVFEKQQFVLESQEQANIKLFVDFPENFPPQQHSYVLLPNIGEKVNVTISFRPAGEQLPNLQLIDVDHRVSEGVLFVDFVMRNTGNVYLRVTPSMIVQSNESVVKEMLIPQAFVISPRESFPLTLRQDLSEFDTGEFTAVVTASFSVDELSGESRTQELEFSYVKEELELTDENQLLLLILLSISIFFGVLGSLWIHHRTKKHKRVISEPIIRMKKEVALARKEIGVLSKQTRLLVDEVHQWNTRR